MLSQKLNTSVILFLQKAAKIASPKIGDHHVELRRDTSHAVKSVNLCPQSSILLLEYCCSVMCPWRIDFLHILEMNWC